MVLAEADDPALRPRNQLHGRGWPSARNDDQKLTCTVDASRDVRNRTKRDEAKRRQSRNQHWLNAARRTGQPQLLSDAHAEHWTIMYHGVKIVGHMTLAHRTAQAPSQRTACHKLDDSV